MKKVLFSVLMISAMFVAASCGSKSNSNEADEPTQIEFTNPALNYNQFYYNFGHSNFDLTDYVSAESVTPPALVPDEGDNALYKQIAINATLKKIKEIDVPESNWRWAAVQFELCDKNGTCLVKTDYQSVEVYKIAINKAFTVSARTKGDYESDYEQILGQIQKVRVNIGGMFYEAE